MKKALISFVLLALVLISIAVWPYLYNYHLYSLARLKNSIEIGDKYEEVVEQFKEYQSTHQDDGELQVSIDDDKLFVYHVNVFDDCQLTVNFDASGKVNDIKYIGD